MIDKPVATMAPAPFSPLVRALIDSVSEALVVFDVQGRFLYANAPARRALEGINGDLRPRLQTMGARFIPLRSGTQSLGEAAILPTGTATAPLTLADRERQAIAETLQGTSGRLAETARRLGISRTTLWRRLKAYGLDSYRPTP